MSTVHELHEAICAARRDHHAAEYRLACLLLQMKQSRGYDELGYSSIHHYARVVLDLHTKKTRALLRLALAMPDLPGLEEAFSSGRIGWTKAREILRVATPDNEQAWIERAEETTSRELEELVSHAAKGDDPPDDVPLDKAPARQRKTFVFEAADLDALYQALALMRAQCGEGTEVEDGVLLAELARRHLRAQEQDEESHEAPTGEPCRVVIIHCPSCRRTEGVDSELSDTVVSEAACDHDVVDMREGPDKGKRTRAIPPRVRRAVMHRDRYRCRVPGCRNRGWLHLHHEPEFARGGEHREEDLLALCSVHHRQRHEGRLGIRKIDGEASVFDFAFPDGREVRSGPRGPIWGSSRGARHRHEASEATADTDASAGTADDQPSRPEGRGAESPSESGPHHREPDPGGPRGASSDALADAESPEVEAAAK